MKYGLLVLICTIFLFQGYSQVHLTRTRVKYKRKDGFRIVKSIQCDVREGQDALFRNYQKGGESLVDWWFQLGELKGQMPAFSEGDTSYWQIDMGQRQLTAVQRYARDGALEGWEFSSQQDTLFLSNFQPDVFAKDRLVCSFGRRYTEPEQAAEPSLEKMLLFRQRKPGNASLMIEEAYSADSCPDDFRVFAAFVATWILAKEYSAF